MYHYYLQDITVILAVLSRYTVAYAPVTLTDKPSTDCPPTEFSHIGGQSMGCLSLSVAGLFLVRGQSVAVRRLLLVGGKFRNCFQILATD